MVGRKLLLSTKDGGRRYVIALTNNFIQRSIMRQLEKKGFLPSNEQFE